MSTRVLERSAIAEAKPDRAASGRRWRRRVPSRRLLPGGIGLVLLAAIGWYGHGWWTVGRFLDSTDDAYVGGDVTVVAPQVSGFITGLAVTDNQAVHAGQLLLVIDDRIYRAALARAEAAVAARQAALANIGANRHLQDARIDQARARLITTAAEIARTRGDIDRYRALSHDQWASAQRYQQADAVFQAAVGADAEARAALEAAVRQRDVIDTEARQADAALLSVIADRDIAGLNIGYTRLRAPIDGVIGNRSAQAGAFAPIGAQLLSLVPSHHLWVDANFKESQLARMRPGQPVTIAADVLPGVRFGGHVDSLSPASGAQFSVLPAENATGNFTKIVQRLPVKILISPGQNEAKLLRLGFSVETTINTALADVAAEQRGTTSRLTATPP